VKIICAYAPPDDCIGSEYGKVGGKCEKFNDCVKYAKFLAKRMNISETDDAQLFSAAGMPTDRLRQLMALSPVYETGFFQPKSELIERGIAMEARSWRVLLANQRKRVRLKSCTAESAPR